MNHEQITALNQFLDGEMKRRGLRRDVQLARELGVNSMVIHRIRKGEFSPTARALALLVITGRYYAEPEVTTA